MEAWNGWYHVDCHTYGTWLPGDPRGWREKRHRKHVTGDYHNPPPKGTGDLMHQRAHQALKQAPVHLDRSQREIAGRALVEMLVSQQIEVLAVSLDSIHFHVLARFPDKQVRPPVGRAKKHAYHCLRDRGRTGKLWERKSHVTPITGRKHQVNVFRYITGHKQQGAWVWTFREGLYWLDNHGQ